MPGFTELAAGVDPATNMASPAAQDWVLMNITRGNHPPLEWYPVTRTVGDVTAHFTVSNRLRIGDEQDSVIPLTTADTEQKLADNFNAYLATPTLFDAIAAASDLVSYVSLQHRDVADLSFEQMVKNSREIDQRYAGKSPSLREMAKSWMVSAWYNDPVASGLRIGANTGINYGAALRGPAGPGNANPWPSTSLPAELRVWQPPGGRGQHYHSTKHTDISQKAPHLVLGVVTLTQPGHDTKAVLLEDLAKDPTLHKLVSSQGPVDSMRIPTDGGGTGPSGGPVGPVTPVGNKPNTNKAALLGVGVVALAATIYLLS